MISIICLIHNNDKPSPTLLSSIDSVIGQTFQDWELKLVFYNTQAPAPTLIPTFEDKRIEVKNYGEDFKTYIQTLLDVVNNDAVYNHIGILDVNDIWEPNKLELQVAKLKEFPRIDVIGTKSKYDTGVGLEPEIPINGLYNYNLFKVNPFINSSVVFKRDVLRYIKNDIDNKIDIANEVYKETKKHAQYFINELWLQLTLQDSVLYNINQVALTHKTPYQINHYKTCYASEYFKNIISDFKNNYIYHDTFNLKKT